MRHVLIVAICLLSGVSISQEIVKATSQRWVGGACCSSGTNYTVHIRFEKEQRSVSIKQVWLKGHGLVLAQCNKVSGAPTEYMITFGVSSTQAIPVDENIVDQIEGHNEEVPEFEGEALIVLDLFNKEKRLTVFEFQNLMAIPMPQAPSR